MIFLIELYHKTSQEGALAIVIRHISGGNIWFANTFLAQSKLTMK